MLTPEEKKQRAQEARRRFRAKYPITIWKPVPEGLNTKPNRSTIAIVQKGKKLAPNPDKKLSTKEVIEGIYKILDLAFKKLGILIERDTQGNITTI
jgi:isopentenyl diphosphate isomerase/L-lactate dehydrogenase-like FMN-dependent dehydrogenase